MDKMTEHDEKRKSAVEAVSTARTDTVKRHVNDDARFRSAKRRVSGLEYTDFIFCLNIFLFLIMFRDDCFF